MKRLLILLLPLFLFGQTTNFVNIKTSGYAHIGKVYHAYGGFQDSSIEISLTQNEWAQVTNTSGNLFSGDEVDGFSLSNDTIIVANGCDYSGIVVIGFGGGNTMEYQLRVYNVTQSIQVGYDIGITSTGVSNFSIITLPLYVEANANDRFVLQIRNISGATNPIIKFGQFEIRCLHE